ncbi:MAG: hypothetical protein WCO42_08555 [bacterium]
MTQEIQGYLSSVKRGEAGELSMTLAFPPEFSGFRGHFPGRPVLPGVCMVQTALVALGATHQTTIRLRRLVAAKWMAPVLPGEELGFTLRVKEGESGASRVKVVVTRASEKIAEFSIEVTGMPKGAGGS